MELSKSISREVLEDIFVTALEGGSNYWYTIPSKEIRAVRNAVSKEEDPYFASAILKAVLDHGVDVDVNDCENEEDLVGTISKSTMNARLQLLADSEHSWALDEQLNGEGDANSADIVFQYITIGELIYG